MKDTIDKHARLTNKNKKMRKKNKRADDALGRAHRARRQLQENEKKIIQEPRLILARYPRP